MDTWIIYMFNGFGYPKLKVKEITASDIKSAMSDPYIIESEIIKIELKVG